MAPKRSKQNDILTGIDALIEEILVDAYGEDEQLWAFRQDGIKAWNEYQSSGFHVTFEEADDWIAELEAGNDVDIPECHD